MNIFGQWLKTSNVSTVVPLLREDVYYIDACVLNKWLDVPLYTEASRMGSWQSTLKIAQKQYYWLFPQLQRSS